MKPFLLSLLALCGITFSALAQSTAKYSIGSGEYQNFILDNTTHTLYGLGTGGNGEGNNTGVMGYPIKCQFPSANTQIKFVASGLHTATAIDMSGNVYFAGPNEDGSMGNGTTSGTAKAFQAIPTDSAGNAFTNVTMTKMASSIFTGGAGYGAIIYAIKSDGTLWVWGNTQGGYRGDGTYGRVNTRPVQVPFPAGTVITKVMVQNIAIALDSKGNVWTWGGNGGNNVLLGNVAQADYKSPHILPLPGAAKDIAGGGLYSYALLTDGSLYGWGLYLGYMGVGSAATAGYATPATPVLLNSDLNLPAAISKISTNQTTTYAILTDGTLWAWGGSECGQAGNGSHIDYSKYTVNPAPYGGTTYAYYAWNWDMSTAQCQQHKPVNIAPGINNFVELSEGVQAVFYKFAVDANGQLYSWGRNKYGVLANGVMDANYIDGTIGATYPNSFDVPYITAINPFASTNTKTIQSTSPYCISHPTATACPIYAIPSNTAPKAVPGSNQTVSGTTATLDGSGSTDNVAIVYYLWTQVSGPSTATISIPSGKKVNLSGLKTGTYKFQLKVTDNGWLSDSATVTVTVGTALKPVANAGADQTITLPTNSTTLAGSGSETGGTISSYKWVMVTGPSTPTIAAATSASTAVSSLVQGTYKFALTVTDAAGTTASDTMLVTVKPAAVSNLVANAGADQTITLPTSSTTLTGSGSETNGTIASYAWKLVSGPASATIASPTAATTAVSAMTAFGTYVFQLTVTDKLGNTATDQVNVLVNPAAVVVGPPTANAGSDVTITLPASSTTLTGSGTESNGSISSYAWKQTSGPSTATIGTATAASTTVSNLVQGSYVFTLTVTDKQGKTGTDQVTVTVNAAAAGAPSASAGSAQTITLPTNSIALYGSGSETNGSIVSYAWSQSSGPNTAYIVTPAAAYCTMSGLVQGAYVFKLTVTDKLGKTASATVTVTVNAAPPTPVANAGADVSIVLPVNSVTLDGLGSEKGGSIAAYSWSQVSGPASAFIMSPSSGYCTMAGLVAGTYVFKFTVKDKNGVTASDNININVRSTAVASSSYPSANAGNNQTIILPTSSATLAGSGSETGGSIVSYGWLQVSGPSAAVVSAPDANSTTVSSLVEGTYVFQLLATDASGQAGADQVTVTVSKPSTSLVANAGPDQDVSQSVAYVSLNGTGSTDAGGTITSYQWIQVSGAAGVTITNSLTATPDVYGMQPGSYVFELKVTDNTGATATDQVMITVTPDGTLIANAGKSDTVSLPINAVTLDGSASSDGSGAITSYEWTEVSGPSTATLASPDQVTTSASGLVAGVYLFELKVKDGSGQSAISEVQIVVTNSEQRYTNAVKLYPNPAIDVLNIWYQSSADEKLNIQIFNAAGVNVMTTEYTKSAGPVNYTLNVSGLGRGVYVLKINSASTGRTVKMFVKQ